MLYCDCRCVQFEIFFADSPPPPPPHTPPPSPKDTHNTCGTIIILHIFLILDVLPTNVQTFPAAHFLAACKYVWVYYQGQGSVEVMTHIPPDMCRGTNYSLNSHEVASVVLATYSWPDQVSKKY